VKKRVNVKKYFSLYIKNEYPKMDDYIYVQDIAGNIIKIKINYDIAMNEISMIL
jgi:hypothetical protein